jgi:decaprenyl-phosphate phosphoribosyltransferase
MASEPIGLPPAAVPRGRAERTTPRTRSVPAAVLVAARPRQWLKNVLVAAAPLAAGTLLQPHVLASTLCAMAAFSLLSASVYLVNDVLDAEHDRAHPDKRSRPVASGELTAGLAVGVAAVLASLSFAASLLVGWQLTAVLAVYLAGASAYSLGVKRQPVFDLALVASGFVLRALAGAVATGVPLSEWFLLVASFGALFMVAGKRYADVVHPGVDPVDPGAVGYTASFLRFVWGMAAAVTITGYALWAFQVGASRGGVGWAQLSIAPLTLGVLRYAVDIDRGRAGAPEDVVLGDWALIVLGAVWVALFWLAADVS